MKNKKSQAAMEFLMTYGWAILGVVVVMFVLWYFIFYSPPDELSCITQTYHIVEVDKINIENCISVVNINKTEIYDWENYTVTQTYDLSPPLPYQDDGKCWKEQVGVAYCDEKICVLSDAGICILRKYCPNGYEIYDESIEEGDTIIDTNGWRCV